MVEYAQMKPNIKPPPFALQSVAWAWSASGKQTTLMSEYAWMKPNIKPRRFALQSVAWAWSASGKLTTLMTEYAYIAEYAYMTKYTYMHRMSMCEYEFMHAPWSASRKLTTLVSKSRAWSPWSASRKQTTLVSKSRASSSWLGLSKWFNNTEIPDSRPKSEKPICFEKIRRVTELRYVNSTYFNLAFFNLINSTQPNSTQLSFARAEPDPAPGHIFVYGFAPPSGFWSSPASGPEKCR